MPAQDYLKYYHLERYLFEDVHQRFHSDNYLNAFDFFSIIIWKANRAKSKIARKLLCKDPEGRKDLDEIVRTLTEVLYEASDHKERMRLLIKDWSFQLPIASAILTVLWPEDFTVYDTRVCKILGDFQYLKNKSKFEVIWEGYNNFKSRIESSAPEEFSLR